MTWRTFYNLKYQFRYKCALQKKCSLLQVCTGIYQSFPKSVFFSMTPIICRRLSKPRTLLFEDAQVEALHELGDQNPQRSDSVIKGGVFASSGAFTLVRSNLTVPLGVVDVVCIYSWDSQKNQRYNIWGYIKWIKEFPRKKTQLQPTEPWFFIGLNG